MSARTKLLRWWLAAAVVVAGWIVSTLGRADAPTGRYAFPSADVVTDSKTGLGWQRGTSSAPADWGQAAVYCQSLTLDGTGWRLPSMKELHTIVDISRAIPAIDATAFPDSMSDQYWSSSPLVGVPTDAWAIDFRNGAARTTARDGLNWVRCVR